MKRHASIVIFTLSVHAVPLTLTAYLLLVSLREGLRSLQLQCVFSVGLNGTLSCPSLPGTVSSFSTMKDSLHAGTYRGMTVRHLAFGC